MEGKIPIRSVINRYQSDVKFKSLVDRLYSFVDSGLYTVNDIKMSALAVDFIYKSEQQKLAPDQEG